VSDHHLYGEGVTYVPTQPPHDLLLAAQEQVLLVKSENKNNKKDGHVTIVGKQIHTEVAGMDASEEDGIVLIKCKL
jgi:hypothetical protein